MGQAPLWALWLHQRTNKSKKGRLPSDGGHFKQATRQGSSKRGHRTCPTKGPDLGGPGVLSGDGVAQDSSQPQGTVQIVASF